MSLVSIIMPYYKKENFIKSSVISLLNQTYQNFEIIIIDDEASKDSSKILNEIKTLDSRIKLIANKSNIGAGLSRNKAIKNSKGELIAFCDCDDLWKSSKLQIQLSFMKKHNLDFSFTSYEIINEVGEVIGERKAKKVINFQNLIKSCDIGLSTVILNRKFFLNDKFQFAKLKTKEDFVLWLELAKNEVKMLGIEDNLSCWRKCKNSLSSYTFQKLLDGYKVYRVHLNYGRLKSFVYLLLLSINFIIKK